MGYIRSNVGIFTQLVPNHDFAWPTAEDILDLGQTPPYCPGFPEPDYGRYSDFRVRMAARHSVQYIPANIYNTWPAGQNFVCFGFNLFDEDEQPLHKTYRVVIRKLPGDTGQGQAYLQIYNQLTGQVDVEQQAPSINLAHSSEFDVLFSCTLQRFQLRTCLVVTFANASYVGDTLYWQMYPFTMLLEAGDYCIIPTGSHGNTDEHDDPNEDDDGNSDEGGGGGSHNRDSDNVREDSLTDLNPVVGGGGFITYYKITQAQLASLASEMFSETFAQAIANYFEKPSEIVCGLLLLPVTPVGGASYYPRYGVFHMNLALPVVADRFIDVDMGSVAIDEYYGSAFDYSPYTQISIFLPFIGVREIDVDEVMGGYITVKYRIDTYTGNCVAFVIVDSGTVGTMTVRYQFAGNCGQQMPVASADFSSVINGAIQVATVAAASVVTAGAAGVAAGAAAEGAGAAAAEVEAISASAQAAANTKAAMDIGGAALTTVMSAKPTYTRTGSMSCSVGMMGVLKPYILKKFPRQSLPDGYKSFYGYPSNISGTLSGFSGFTVVDSVKLKGIPATDTEIAEIENALKGGVFL